MSGYTIYRVEADGSKNVIAFAQNEHEAALIMDMERDKADDETRIVAERDET